MWKKYGIVCFEVVFQNSARRTDGRHQTLSQGSRCTGPVLNGHSAARKLQRQTARED